MVTWLLGLPSSSSHALFGGLIGATIVGVGASAVNFGVVLSKIMLPALIAPVTAGIIAYSATKLAYALTRRYDSRPDGRAGFRPGQIFTSSLVALAHGTNDAQKTMGIITLMLISVGWQTQTEPETWVIFACAITIALGTYVGGWRIIRTLGKGLTDVKPAQGFSAEASTASTILSSSVLGFALSTTQVASGSVIGSGLGRRGSTVRWRTAGRIGVGWILTLPAAGAVGALCALMVRWLDGWGILIDAVAAVIVIVALFLRSRVNAVTAGNAMSEVAESGTAVKVKRNPPPTRRQRAIQREQAATREGVVEVNVTIDWWAFVQVFVASITAAILIVGFYSLGLRLLVRAGRAPVVAPAEFTDAITVVSEKDRLPRSEGGSEGGPQEPSDGGAEAVRLRGRLRLVRALRPRGARRAPAHRPQVT